MGKILSRYTLAFKKLRLSNTYFLKNRVKLFFNFAYIFVFFRTGRTIHLENELMDVNVIPVPEPVVHISGTSDISREYEDFKLGVRIFADVHIVMTTGSPTGTGTVKSGFREPVFPESGIPRIRNGIFKFFFFYCITWDTWDMWTEIDTASAF